MSVAASASVFLVGAGPGDPDLLTVRALRLLQRADVVLHDALVDRAILALAPRARLIDVGKRCGRRSTAQRFINRALVAAARRVGPEGCVVRLKGGDPTIFGRLDEEMDALRAAGLGFEVVPGVTAASAAAAALSASLTRRGVARSLRIITPRLAAGALPSADDLQALRAAPGETLVVYMAGELVGTLAAGWLAAGQSPDLPVAIVEDASRPTQRLWRGTLSQAVEPPGTAGGAILLIVGDALQQQHAAALPGTLASIVTQAGTQTRMPTVMQGRVAA